MRILRKEGANILVVASPAENVRLGDYLMVADKDDPSIHPGHFGRYLLAGIVVILIVVYVGAVVMGNHDYGRRT